MIIPMYYIYMYVGDERTPAPFFRTFGKTQHPNSDVYDNDT
jgi:hypothetical protein